MRSAHSVSLQIYVFPFTCFAFSSFFCHFVSPSPSPLPSFPLIAQPHRAVCPGVGKGEIGAPFRSPASSLPLSRGRPLAGFACFLLTRMSTAGRRVGEGRFFFVSPPLSSFPLILYLLGGVCNHCVQLHKRGIGALCAVFRRHIGLPAPPRKEPAWAASGGLRHVKKRGRKCAETGRFLHRLPPFALESGARRGPSNRVVVVRGRAQTVLAANETNAEQKRNL